ncbi:hypothetical protein EXIGLDRAFT_762791 [Exidia glandulosa HHB12029]|uniref:Uncharacterized protein n=1 Tax=Exidia glandulosa HHB12029 TaxID=1314781 RepID=A0A165MH89_EXIGL|nr:hypothetical protein EXIGLDRAFT_762791 [Exidia glandulosa HHB12029]
MVLTACPALLFAGNSALDHGLFALLRQVEGPPRITVFRSPSPSAQPSPQCISNWTPTPSQDNAGGEEEDVENILRRSPATALSETIIIGRGPPRSFDSYDKEVRRLYPSFLPSRPPLFRLSSRPSHPRPPTPHIHVLDMDEIVQRTAMGNHILALQNRISEYQRQQADGDAKIRDLEQKHKDAEGVLSRELAKRDEELKRLTLEIEKLRDTAKNKMG